VSFIVLPYQITPLSGSSLFKIQSNTFLLLWGLVELWATRGVVQAPCGQRHVVHQARQIHQPGGNVFLPFWIYKEKAAAKSVPRALARKTPFYNFKSFKNFMWR
jgi:hypothetical protein